MLFLGWVGVGGVSNAAFASGLCSFGAPDVFVLFSGLGVGGFGGGVLVTSRLLPVYVRWWLPDVLVLFQGWPWEGVGGLGALRLSQVIRIRPCMAPISLVSSPGKPAHTTPPDH